MGHQTVLLDTSIIVEIMRDRPLGRHVMKEVRLYQGGVRAFVAVVSFGEILAFARFNNWGSKKLASLNNLLSLLVPVSLDGRDIHERYAEISADARSRGKSLGDNDRWIAACASVTESVLFTSDKDFDGIPERLLKHVYFDQRASYPA